MEVLKESVSIEKGGRKGLRGFRRYNIAWGGHYIKSSIKKFRDNEFNEMFFFMTVKNDLRKFAILQTVVRRLTEQC